MSKTATRKNKFVARVADVEKHLETLCTAIKNHGTVFHATVTALWEAIGDLRKNVGDVRLDFNRFVVAINNSLASSYAKIKEDFLSLEQRTATGFERVEKDVKGLRADVDRAWSLNASRDALHRKVSDDTNRTLETLTRLLQSFNERLSKLEGKVSVLDEVRNVTGNQIGMLGECVASHNQRIWKVEEDSNQPSIVDQMIVDSKLTGVYGKIADLERRLRAAESSSSLNQCSTPRTLTVAASECAAGRPSLNQGR